MEATRLVIIISVPVLGSKAAPTTYGAHEQISWQSIIPAPERSEH